MFSFFNDEQEVRQKLARTQVGRSPGAGEVSLMPVFEPGRSVSMHYQLVQL